MERSDLFHCRFYCTRFTLGYPGFHQHTAGSEPEQRSKLTSECLHPRMGFFTRFLLQYFDHWSIEKTNRIQFILYFRWLSNQVQVTVPRQATERPQMLAIFSLNEAWTRGLVAPSQTDNPTRQTERRLYLAWIYDEQDIIHFLRSWWNSCWDGQALHQC